MFMNGKNGYFIRCTFMNALNVDYSPDFFISVGEDTEVILAKIQWTFAIGECPVGESHIGEIGITHLNILVL
jgi:hypothetical protein